MADGSPGIDGEELQGGGVEQVLYGNHVVGECGACSKMIETQEDIYMGDIEQVRFYNMWVTTVVLGNKCDLQEQCQVDYDAAQHWAKGKKVKLWEVSVADQHTLIELFVYLASKMTQPQSKSAFPLSHKNGSGSMDG
ncbi:NF-kappa-B inhibitor-interacting Ras-like protein 2 [Colius striatus]|uniref:NF-kappa-B inhibitor-interacting Ras-like protein 2 n=1 Tax=Colius striatus TaxID=57412 RepID=UPI002B1DE716|nr:NF-kappa-B inhibitor-interacting Ras-like protein 2 [Colius striatus]